MDRGNQFDPESDVCDASKPSDGPSEYICMNVHRRMAEGLLLASVILPCKENWIYG